MNLGHLERDYFSFLLRDGTCQAGKIRAISRESVTLDQGGRPRGQIAITRTEVLQVRDSDPLYSARSSWSDVGLVQQHKHEHLIVKLKSGKTISGPAAGVIGEQLSLRTVSDVKWIAKADLATVDWVRVTPAARLQWLAQEAGPAAVLFPNMWPRMLGIGLLMTVRLYDADQPEDNSPAACPAPPLP